MVINIDNFKLMKLKKFKNTCVYIGSFFKGKGVEQIFRLAKLNKKSIMLMDVAGWK